MTLALSPDELQTLTGYSRGAEQLRVLHSRGYWRAYRAADGAVVLTRAHYEAVERGEDRQGKMVARPALRLAT